MKNIFLQIFILALLFSACNSTTQNTKDNNTTTGDSTITECDSVTTENEAQNDESVSENIMLEIWKQIEKMPFDEEAEEAIFYDDNYLTYELGLYQHRQREIKSFKIGEATYQVFDLYENTRYYDDEIESEAYHIKEYIFKDGILSECQLQDELKDYAETSAFFKDGKLNILENDTIIAFVWDGTKMVKE